MCAWFGKGVLVFYIHLSIFQGVLSNVVNWKALNSQYYEDKVYVDKIKPMLRSGERRNIGHHADHIYLSHTDKQGHPVDDRSHIDTTYSDPDIVKDSAKVRGTISTSDDTIYDRAFRTLFTPLGLGSVVKQFNRVADVKSKSFSKDAESVVVNVERVVKNKPANLGSSVLNQFRKIEDVKAKSFHRGGTAHSSESKDVGKFQNQSLDRETMDFMRRLMDDLTHLGNYSTPVDTGLIIGM